jgi:integrase
VNPKAGKVTLADHHTDWRRSADLRPKTAQLYDGLWKRHIEPKLGNVELGQLTTARVRAWHRELARSASNDIAAKAYRLLRAMLSLAVEDKLIAANPCQGRSLKHAGREDARERPVATVAEVEALAAGMPERWSLLVLLAGWLGLRRGELLGLQRGDIDLLRRTVRIERSAVYMDNGSRMVGEPKTKAGRRTVAIPPHLLPTIESHLASHVGPDAEAPVFTAAQGGMVRTARLQQAWNRARTAIGRPELHIHDLRHSANLLAAATGASTKQLMARMGHASAAAALRYQHATEDGDRTIAEMLSGMRQPAELVHAEERFGTS